MSAAEEKDLKSIPSNIIKDGDYAFLIYDKRRQWVKKVEKDQTFHCDRGFIEYNKLIGKEFGHKFWLSSGKKMGVLKPTLTEKIFHMKRRSQIIYPEDAALILAYGNVRPGTNILEAGTGSASLTSCLGKYCRPKGTVNTFEVRKVAFKQAKQNIKMMGLEDIVTCNFGDLLEVLDQYSDIDFVSLDLPNTWDVVPNLRKIVSETGRICLFSPVIEQVEKNVQSFRENEFYNIINLEMIKREFQVKPNATRPYGRTVGHSGYLSFATKAEEVPLLTEQFTSLYSPQNIGYLLLYGNIGVDSKLLIFGEQKSPLIEILNHRFGNSLNFEVSLKRESLDSEQKKYDVILIDNKCENQLVDFLEKFLEPGGTVLSIQKYIQNMKEIHDQMYLQKFTGIKSAELIKREIVFEDKGAYSKYPHLGSAGYLTYGRKILDELPKKPKKPEPVGKDEEILIDVGVIESDEPEEEKIDYANLRE